AILIGMTVPGLPLAMRSPPINLRAPTVSRTKRSNLSEVQPLNLTRRLIPVVGSLTARVVARFEMVRQIGDVQRQRAQKRLMHQMQRTIDNIRRVDAKMHITTPKPMTTRTPEPEPRTMMKSVTTSNTTSHHGTETAVDGIEKSVVTTMKPNLVSTDRATASGPTDESL